MDKQHKIAVIGLGYVGLPLAVAFAEKFPVIGFDINQERVDELADGTDHTLEVSDDLLQKALQGNGDKKLEVTTKAEDMRDANIFIVTVPTPTDKNRQPVLTPLVKASETIAKVLKDGDIVIYESTVYPGVTEEVCVPVLEKHSIKTFLLVILQKESIQAIKFTPLPKYLKLLQVRRQKLPK